MANRLFCEPNSHRADGNKGAGVASDQMVRLEAAIQALREQLTQARRDGWYDELGLKVEPLELTLQVVVDKGAHGKFEWFMLGVGSEYKSATIQTLNPAVVVRDQGDCSRRW